MKRKLVSLAAAAAVTAAMMSVAIPGVMAAPETATNPTWTEEGTLWYDVAGAQVYGGTYLNTAAGNFAGFDGTAYIWEGDGSFELNLNVPIAGNYDITLRAASDTAESANEYEKLFINGGSELAITLNGTQGREWGTAKVGNANWDNNNNYVATPPEEGIPLQAGSNIFRVECGWGYSAYDSITLTPKFELSGGEELMMDITNLPAVVTLENKETVEALEARYQALSAEEKAKVTNYSVLQAALETIEELDQLQVQQPVVDGDTLTYEVEKGSLTGSASVEDTLTGFSGDGYVEIAEGEGVSATISMRIFVPEAGKYNLTMTAAKVGTGNGCDTLSVNGGSNLYLSVYGEQNQWTETVPGTENWAEGVLQPTPVAVELKEGENTLTISKSWSFGTAYDKIVLTPNAEGGNPGEGEEPGEGEDNPPEASKIQQVEQAISALPSVIGSDDVEAVNAAWAAYEALTAEEQSQVRNVNKLLVSCARIRAIEAGDEQENALRFEAETGVMAGNSSAVGADGAMKDYKGDGYVFLFDASFTVDVYVPQNGQYDIYIIGASDSGEDKSDYVSINGGEQLLTSYLGSTKGTWVSCQPGTEDYLDGKLAPKAPENGYALKAGKNTIEISANWGYSCYDAIVVVPRFDMVITDDVPDTGVAAPIAALAVFGTACIGLATALPRRRKSLGETIEK